MTLKISRETIPTEEIIYNGLQEQGVELDYILPDYFPDISVLCGAKLSRQSLTIPLTAALFPMSLAVKSALSTAAKTVLLSNA